MSAVEVVEIGRFFCHVRYCQILYELYHEDLVGGWWLVDAVYVPGLWLSHSTYLILVYIGYRYVPTYLPKYNTWEARGQLLHACSIVA